MISLQVNVKSFKEKRVVKVFGYEMILRSAKKNGNAEKKANEGDDEAKADNDKEADEGGIELISRTEVLWLEYLEVDSLEMIPLVPSNTGPDDLEEVVTSDNWDLWLKQDCKNSIWFCTINQ